jgi:hypothetical protein
MATRERLAQIKHEIAELRKGKPLLRAEGAIVTNRNAGSSELSQDDT